MGCLDPTGVTDMFLSLATLPQNSLWLLFGLSRNHEHLSVYGARPMSRVNLMVFKETGFLMNKLPACGEIGAIFNLKKSIF